MGKTTPQMKSLGILAILLVFIIFIVPASNYNSGEFFFQKDALIPISSLKENLYKNAQAATTAPEDVSVNTDPGECFATGVDLGDPQIENGQEASNDAPSQFPLGETVVTWTFTDGEENETTDTQIVTVIDNENPAITAPESIIENLTANECEAEVEITAPDVTDNCSNNITIEGVRDDGEELDAPYPYGVTTIIWTATDEANNNSAAEQRIEIRKNETPTIIAPEDKELLTSENDIACSTVVDLGSPETNDNCNAYEISTSVDGEIIDPDSYQFPLKETTVTWIATDPFGQTASDTQIINIIDDEYPVADIRNPTIFVGEDGNIALSTSDFDNGSTDNCDISFSLNKTNFTCSNLGENVVDVTITDTYGNSVPEIISVTVEDTISPVAKTKNIPLFLDETGNVTLLPADIDDGSSDNCGFTLSINKEKFTCSDLGENVVDLTVTDASGNSNSAGATVTIIDNIAPVIETPDDIEQGNDPGECFATIDISTPNATDNCNIDAPVGTRDDGEDLTAAYPVGTTTITWNVTDNAGNNAEPVEQIITVKDTEQPVELTLPDVYSSCEITLTPPNTTDNCNGEITATTEDPLTYYPQNNATTHTITWEFEDEHGNIREVTQLVHINPIFLNSEDIEITHITCNGGNDGRIAVTASGGEPPFTYAINNGPFTSNSTFEDLSAGIYTIQVKDAYDCVLEEEIEIVEPDALNLEDEMTSTIAESCFGAGDGKIIINGTLTGGTGEYEYSANNEYFSNTSTISGLPAGDYEVVIRDTNGCSLSRHIEVTVEGPDEMQAEVEAIPATCYDSNTGSIEISNPSGGNTSPYYFRINNGNWQEATSTGYVFTDLEKGGYEVEMMDDTGCIRMLKNVTISQPNELTADITTTRTTTYGSATGTASVEAAGGNGTFTYEWRDSEGNLIHTTPTVNDFVAGVYELTIRDGAGCIYRENVEIFDIISADITARSACVDEEDTIRTSYFEVNTEEVYGGEGDPATYTYEWSFGADASLPDGTTGFGPHTVTYTSIGDKIITLKVTDRAGVSTTFTTEHYVGNCYPECDSSSNFSSHDDSFYIGDANGTKMEPGNCEDDEPMYLWFIVDKSSNGHRLYSDYVYTVKDGNTTTEDRVTNCFGILEDGTFEEDFDGEGEAQEMVSGQLVRLNKIGAGDNEINWECDQILSIIHITYKWTNNSTKSCGETVKNMCAATNETISVATPIRATADATNTCHGASDGSIIVYASGGTGSFTYSALNTTTGDKFESDINVFNNLPAGNYTVTITDKKDVSEDLGQEQYSYELTDIIVEESESALEASVEITQDILCYGGKGSAKVTENGGTAPYTYQWNDDANQTTAEATDLEAGTYTVTVTDDLGCYTTETITLTQPEEIPTADAGDAITSCGFSFTTLGANDPAPGNGQWEIISGEGGNIEDVTDPNSRFTGPDGEYTLRWTITSNNGLCITEDEAVIKIIEDCNNLDFDGIDDYVDFGDHYNLGSNDFDGSNSFSMEGWIKLKTTSGTRTILSKRDSQDPDAGGYELVVSAGIVSFRWGQGNSLTPDSSTPLNTQRWYHVAVTYDGTTAKLFVDGVQVKSEAATINPGNTPVPFLVGATYDSSRISADGEDRYATRPTSHFRGWIEEVRLWKKAIAPEQLRFMMNQRLENNAGNVKGTVLPLDVPGPLAWGNLAGYYQLLSEEVQNTADGTTKDLAVDKVDGVLKNITTLQDNTAPLPYVSKRDGDWNDISTTTTPWLYGRGLWDAPNSLGINNQPINWNIVEVSHGISSGNKNIEVLGLISKENKAEDIEQSILSIQNPHDKFNNGHSLRVTHYLKLDGIIDLVGESQLLQNKGSILDEESSGYLERDQQGTASSFNYNYWSSPVVPSATSTTYSVNEVMFDGTIPGTNEFKPINFGYRYAHADTPKKDPIRISEYWINAFYPEGDEENANEYSEWRQILRNGEIRRGEGYTMKGSWNISVKEAQERDEYQNYTFKGLPNNGEIIMRKTFPNQNYLIGNPYPSALSVDKFIDDNDEAMNGALYFWDHFSGKTHYLVRYIGGYAVRNKLIGVPAISTDERINATGDQGDKSPGAYVPVGQAFFINTAIDASFGANNNIDPGNIVFNNEQRVFVTETDASDSQFLKPEHPVKKEKEQAIYTKDNRYILRINYSSPEGYWRQIAVGADTRTTTGPDYGYDAPLIDEADEDMFWIIDESEYVIQGVPDFNVDRVLPLGIKTNKEGEFTIKIHNFENIPDHLDIYLRDNTDSTYHDLREAEYKSSVEPGYYPEKYDIVFHKEEKIEGKEEETGDNALEIAYATDSREILLHNPELREIKEVFIYSLSGQQVGHFSNIPTQEEIRLGVQNPLSSAAYIVKAITNKGNESKKIIIKRE